MRHQILWPAVVAVIFATPVSALRRSSDRLDVATPLSFAHRFQQQTADDEEAEPDDAETTVVAEAQQADALEDNWSSRQEANDEEAKRHDDESVTKELKKDAKEQARQISGEAAKETAMMLRDLESESELEEDVMNREDKDRKEELAEEHKRAVDAQKAAEEAVHEANEVTAEKPEIVPTESKLDLAAASGEQLISAAEQKEKEEPPASELGTWIESREDLGVDCDKPEVPSKCPNVRKKLKKLAAEEQSLEDEEAALLHESEQQQQQTPSEESEEFRQVLFKVQQGRRHLRSGRPRLQYAAASAVSHMGRTALADTDLPVK